MTQDFCDVPWFLEGIHDDIHHGLVFFVLFVQAFFENYLFHDEPFDRER